MGIEPITYRLQGGCSAVELRRLNDKNAPRLAAPHQYTRAAGAQQGPPSLSRMVGAVNVAAPAPGSPPGTLSGSRSCTTIWNRPPRR